MMNSLEIYETLCSQYQHLTPPGAVVAVQLCFMTFGGSTKIGSEYDPQRNGLAEIIAARPGID